MDTNLTSQVDTFVRGYLIPFGWKLLGAVAVWLVGLIIVRIIRGASRRLMSARRLDPTLATYLDTSLGIMLKVLLAIAMFGVLGVETTSFAALLAAAGLAIGAAWSGLLANFAAGLFLLFLRPFKVGDVVDAGGVNGGTVREIGLFTTALDTADNVRVSVGNNKIFADSIRNYSTNPTRRVDLTAHLVHGIDPIEAMNRVSEQMSSLANVLKQPSPSVDILGFTPTGTVLGVRAYCRNEHVGQVQADANRLIGEVVTNAWEALRLPGDQVRTPQWSDRAH